MDLKKIEFFNRESETGDLMNILGTEPRMVNFIYGPINSGKTSLINNLIENLPPDYVVFYINLRGKFISDYKDFVRVLFDVEKDKDLKEILKKLAIKSEKAIYRTGGVPAPESLLETFFGEGVHEDVFKFLEDYFKNIAEQKIPVLIIDELQKIGDININGPLIYELFNFFIRLTKELHLCHVFALSSDSLFIEKVYSEAMLHGRAEYLLVDDFNKETTKKFLGKYNFSKDEIEIAWNCAGGKPGYLINLVSAKETKKNVCEYAKEMIENRKHALLFMFAENKDKQDVILKMFGNFEKSGEIEFNENINLEILKFLIKRNILFMDALKKSIKPQSKQELVVIREILEERKNKIKIK
ncbi:hypothetical protein BEH94_08855 [Candidatus Altiarchaeales archaeon WOR_SM1_SCG]|nr:hypothetical protein BEH94_08855 [Candidatus Altiarchaeales archaeon WOR_SM1_SCG]